MHKRTVLQIRSFVLAFTVYIHTPAFFCYLPKIKQGDEEDDEQMKGREEKKIPKRTAYIYFMVASHVNTLARCLRCTGIGL